MQQPDALWGDDMWFQRRESLGSLQQQLAALDAELAKAPWNSTQATEAQEVIEAYKPEGKARVQAELAKRGLPSLEESGKFVVKSMFLTARTQAKRNKAQRKINRLTKSLK